MWRSIWFRCWVIWTGLVVGLIACDVFLLEAPQPVDYARCIPGTTRTVDSPLIPGPGSVPERVCTDARRLDGLFFAFLAVVILGPLAIGLVVRAGRRHEIW